MSTKQKAILKPNDNFYTLLIGADAPRKASGWSGDQQHSLKAKQKKDRAVFARFFLVNVLLGSRSGLLS